MGDRAGGRVFTAYIMKIAGRNVEKGILQSYCMQKKYIGTNCSCESTLNYALDNLLGLIPILAGICSIRACISLRFQLL